MLPRVIPMASNHNSNGEPDALRAAVFIDKDGTLVRNVPFNVDPARVQFTDGAFGALQRLADAGFVLVVVSNQPGIGLGYFTQTALEDLGHWIKERLADAGIVLAGFYVCPHRPPVRDAVGCTCRKPNPGLLKRAARDLGVALEHSWMIGDILDDVEAGNRAGCRTVLLDAGNETEWRIEPLRTPSFRANGLPQAAQLIVRERFAASESAQSSEHRA